MRSKLPYIILVLLFVGYLLLELLGPKPTNWNPSFEKDRITPFGSKLVFEALPDIFPSGKITTATQSPSKVLATFEPRPANYIIIQEDFKTNQFEAKALLDFVKRGNAVFISASLFEGSLADSLQINNHDIFWNIFESFGGGSSKDNYVYLMPEYDADLKHYPLLDNVVYAGLDRRYNSELEVLSRDRQDRIMYMRIPYGEGNFYLNSVPLMFTNYTMVDPINHQYVSKCLSFMPDRDVIWDEYFKPTKKRNETSLSYILDQTSLKWAWFVALAGVFLFIIFEGKRRQRIVPILESPKNTSLEFTQTVGLLYHSHGDHKDISEKKIKFFLEYIRNRWGMMTTEIGAEFQAKLASKSGVELDLVQKLFQQITSIQHASQVEPEALWQLSNWIEEFYKKAK